MASSCLKRSWYWAKSPWPDRAARSRPRVALGRYSSWGCLSSPIERSWYCCGAFAVQYDWNRRQNSSFRVRRAQAYLAGEELVCGVDIAPFFACSSACSFPVMPECPGIQQTCTRPGEMAWQRRGRLGQAFARSWKARMVCWLEPLGEPSSCRAASWLSRRIYRFCVYGAWALSRAAFSPSYAAVASASKLHVLGD